MAEKSHFFAYLSRMKYITRWSLMRSSVAENIAEHSLQVATLAHAMAIVKNKLFGGEVDVGRVVTAALYHDASEILTGDLPTPIKYFNPFIKQAYKTIEQSSCEKLCSMLPDDIKDEMSEAIMPQKNPGEAALLKAADKLSAYFKCLEECQGGNGEFKKAAKTTRRQIVEMKLPEAQYMLEHFEQSFSLTLDEMD